MEHTWASGAVELLRHADSHINLETAFDRRIAFISIDNAVETMMRTFVLLPQSKSGVRIGRSKVDEVENSFPGLTTLLWQHAGARLTGIDDADIEHYHRIRNKLYHDGTGLSVDEQYLLAYRQIAVLLLKNLFGVDLGEPRPAPTLERLIMLWNEIQERLVVRLEDEGIPPGQGFIWEMAIKNRLMSDGDAERLAMLRVIRNRVVHSQDVDRTEVKHAVHLAETLLESLKAK